MSSLKKHSLFDESDISLTQFSLSLGSDEDSKHKFQEEDKNESSNTKENDPQLVVTTEAERPCFNVSSPSKLLKESQSNNKTREPIKCSQMDCAKLAIRHDIMDHVSSIIADLVAIDIKYSKLIDFVDKPKVEIRSQASSSRKHNRQPQMAKTPLDDLHNFTVSEINTQLESVRNFIHDLASKYLDAAMAAREKIANLEQDKANLLIELERLRKFY